VSESTLQQYGQQDVPPRGDILFKLARAANVSVQWLATGEGEMRPAGLLPGVAFADVVMVKLRDIHAALHMERIRASPPSAASGSNGRSVSANPTSSAFWRPTRSACYWSTGPREKDCPAVKGCTCFRLLRR
jgi:hypothetical protein